MSDFDLLKAMYAFALSAPDDESVEVSLHKQCQADDPDALAMVRAREALLTEEDRTHVEGYLAIGYFMSLDGDARRAAWLLGMEMATYRRRIRMKQRLALYSPGQPLFQALPKMKSLLRRDELVQATSDLKWRQDGSIHYDLKQIRLDPELPISIPTFFRTQFPDAPLFVRLDPLYAREPSTVMRLDEETLIPADPNWWRSLNIYRGQAKGAAYFIPPPASPVDNLPAFWDYQVLRVRSLEVHARRTEPNYLSMMVEEIQDRRDLDDQVVGLCIHLDTEALQGADPEISPVKHLDLAINVYEGEAAKTRLSQSLANGRVVDATFRSHLLRVENVPMEVLLAVARQFFKSGYLVGDWFADQFKIPR